jgi:hypothetical protein
MIPAADMHRFLAQAQEVAIPLNTQWMPTLLLTVVWIFVGAAVVGMLVRFFGKPRQES